MKVDKQGVLHVSTVQGLFRYDRQTDSFERILDNSYHLFLDGENNVWTTSHGRFGIVRGTDSLEVKTFNRANVNQAADMEMCDDGTVLVATFYGRILSYDRATGEFSSFYSFSNKHIITKIQRVGNRLWVLMRNHGLASIDIPSQTLEGIDDFPISYQGRRVIPRDMLSDKFGRLWIASQQGLWLYDPESGERRLYRHSDADVFSIPHNSVWSLAKDRHDNIWIGTFAGGMCMVDLDERRVFTTFDSHHGDLSHNMVSALAEDHDALWIGTEGGGVNRLDKDARRFSHLTPNGDTSLPINHIKSLVRDGGSGLWIATYLGGVIRYDVEKHTFRYFTNSGPRDQRLVANDLRKIVPEGDRGLWIAYQFNRHVVSFMPLDGNGITHYYFDRQGEQDFILDICRDDNLLWIITQGKLYRMDVESHEVVNVSSDKIPFLNAQSICVDAYGNVWIGTMSGNILRMDARTGEFTAIEGLAGYDASTVYSMCFDRNGALWMGTDNGLFRYLPTTGKFSRFDSADGAQGRVYNPLAAMLTTNGKLLFGGTNGFSIVDPDAATADSQIPGAMISRFIINNSFASPRLGDKAPATWYGREIVLNHRERNFGFRLASDNYSAPTKTRFRYRLAGHEKRWSSIDAYDRTVTYSNIPAGTYRFEVAASTDGETWGETIGVTIVRRPTPWNSAAAWIVYCAVLLTIAGTIVYYWFEKRRLAMKLYFESVDRAKKEELHQSQLRFFTNVSHEFRTPLSLIAGAVDNLNKQGRIDERYRKILGGNSQRLLNLVNELMDFRTIETDNMQLQIEPGDVNGLVKGISTEFGDLAREKRIDFRVECDPNLEGLQGIDRGVVEKIVVNLLNNAFKYTHPGGAITISTHAPDNTFRNKYETHYRIAADREATRRFTIAVSDTGVGISAESISKVFERFYKVNTANTDSHLGTGIGLALVRSLVRLHHGAITIFSERERGTEMVVELPFDMEFYNSDEIRDPAIEETREQVDSRAEAMDMTLSAAESMLMPTREKILLVEDNDDLRGLIADFLSSDYEIVQAVDGLEASRLLAENEIDLIISDIMMPGKDGVTLLREVKERAATSHIPFILLTAKTGIEAKIEGTGSGADIYFEKPVDMSLLKLSLDNIFRRDNTLREYFSKNYFANNSEAAQNERDNVFLKKLIAIIDDNLTAESIDVNFIASELSMSRRKLYARIKTLTDKSIVEFILNYRLRKAAKLIVEEDMNAQQAMESVGIKSQSYFTSVFKKEFGMTPSAFMKSHAKRTAQK
jgi:signal transduction histidine kinase/DNA-binding response OmpR family regulator/ligand-binding sensor domain-containing protein